MPPARQPHGDLDRRQSDQYLGTHGARHWVYNVYNVPCLTKFSIIFCSKYAANILKWIKIYQNDKTKTSFPFEKGPSLKKKTCLSSKTGGKQRHLPPSHFCVAELLRPERRWIAIKLVPLGTSSLIAWQRKWGDPLGEPNFWYLVNPMIPSC